MTPILKVGDRAVFRAKEGANRRDGQIVTITGHSDDRASGRTPVVWPDGARTSALTECLTPVQRTQPKRRVVDEGDLRAVAVGLGMKAADVETLLTLTAIVSAARAS